MARVCMSFLAAAAAAGLAAAPAFADSAGIKSQTEQVLSAWSKEGDEPRLFVEGDVVVETRGDGHLVRLPKMYLGDDDREPQIEIDGATVLLVPAGTDLTEVTVTLPDRIPVLGKKQMVEAVVTIGSQSLKGVWSSQIETFVSTDGTVGDVVVAGPDGANRVTLASASMKGKMEDTGNDQWSGAYDIVATDITVTRPGSFHGNLRIDEAKVTSMGEDLKLIAYAEDMRELGMTWRDGPVSADDPRFKNNQQAMVRALSDVFGVFGYTATLTGIEATTVDGDMGVGEIGFGATYEVDDTGMASSSIQYGHGGLNISQAPPPIADFIPVDVALRLTGDRLPAEQLLTTLMEMGTVEEAAGGDAKKEDALADEIMGRALGLLMKAQSRLTIDTLELTSAALGVEGTGEVTADPGAAMQATGKAEVLVSGLDAALEKYSSLGKEDPEMAQMLAVATMVRGLGKPEAQGGETVYRYTVDLPTDGKVTLNGLDLSALQGMMR